jgi:hypothetical protein
MDHFSFAGANIELIFESTKLSACFFDSDAYIFVFRNENNKIKAQEGDLKSVLWNPEQGDDLNYFLPESRCRAHLTFEFNLFLLILQKFSHIIT